MTAPGSTPSVPASAADSTGGSTGAATESDTTVALNLLSFVPDTLTVKPGTKVTWRNGNDIAHTVTSGTYEVDDATGLRSSEKPDGTFDGQVTKKGDTVTHTFDKPGTYPYYCSIHKGMHGSVVVAE